MKLSTKRKILTVTFKSIRVVAWVVAVVLGIAGFILFVSEPDNSFGAKTEFLLVMIQKTLVSIAMFMIAASSGCLASKITEFFKEHGIK